ncbi:MAG: 3-keto-5-aminohexanoate cleavage protein, partial [Pseudomonadota bacterium]
RVGLEDNLYLERGVYGSNASLTERAVEILRLMGSEVASPDEARDILKLEPRK